MATSTGTPMPVVIRNAGADPSTQYPVSVDSTGALKVAAGGSPAGSGVSVTDRSGTLTTGSTSQQLMAANTSRSLLMIQNPLSATEPLFYAFGTTASTASVSSYSLAPGGALTLQGPGTPTSAINVNAVTTAHVFVASEG